MSHKENTVDKVKHL